MAAVEPNAAAGALAMGARCVKFAPAAPLLHQWSAESGAAMTEASMVRDGHANAIGSTSSAPSQKRQTRARESSNSTSLRAIGLSPMSLE